MRSGSLVLPDVNVLLACVWTGHRHHRPAKRWFDAYEGDIAFCRVTSMGLLRLLSSPSVMGPDVLRRSQCWHVLDHLLLDNRVVVAGEALNLEPIWRVLSSTDDPSHKLWTDDYLAAFAMAAAIPLVTFDRAFAARYPSVRVETLG